MMADFEYCFLDLRNLDICSLTQQKPVMIWIRSQRLMVLFYLPLTSRLVVGLTPITRILFSLHQGHFNKNVININCFRIHITSIIDTKILKFTD